MVMLSTRIDHLERSAKRYRGEGLNRHLTVSCHLPPDDKLSVSHWQYKYKFTPSPPQWDPVIRQIKLIIRELNREFIGFASLHVRVYPTNDSGPFWRINTQFPVYNGKLYTFVMDDGEEFSMSAIVCLHDDFRHLEELDRDHLWIKVGDRWLNLKSWLRIKRCNEAEPVGKLVSMRCGSCGHSCGRSAI